MAKCARKGCVENGTRRVQVPGPGKQTVDVCWTHARELEDLMAKKCAVTVCDSPGGSKGCCSKHYQRFLKLKVLEGLETVTPQQADDFNRRWEAEREANPRMAAGSKGGGAGRAHKAPEPARAATPAPATAGAARPLREAPRPPGASSASTLNVPVVTAKVPPKPLPPPVHPDIRAMDEALLETTRRERDKLSEKALDLAREVAKLKQEIAASAEEREALRADLETVQGERDTLKAITNDLRVQGARREEEIARLNREILNQRHEHAKAQDRWEGANLNASPAIDQTRLTALLRGSLPLRLAFVEAIQDRALLTLRRAAQDPGYADALAADLLALDVPEAG